MKKTITILLLTALCMTVFASCDLSGGLVGELLAEMNKEHVLVDPSVDYYESDVAVIDPIEPWGTVEDPTIMPMPPVEIETTPPYEIPTEDYTGPYTTGEETIEEYWSEDVIIQPIEPLTQIKYFAVYYINCEYISGCEILTELLYTNDDPWVDPPAVTVEQGCDSLSVGGILGLTDAHYARFGYSINYDDPYYAEHYQKDPDPELKEIIFKQGADYVSEYQVTIPLAELPAGSYEIKIWYANYNNEAELATNVEDWICTFKLEIAQPIMD